METWKKHKREWFVNRIGIAVKRSATNFTPQKCLPVLMAQTVIMIATPAHAEACYQWHLDAKVNFEEAQQ